MNFSNRPGTFLNELIDSIAESISIPKQAVHSIEDNKLYKLNFPTKCVSKVYLLFLYM